MTENDGLKARLRSDLTVAMKARDTLTTGTLRMALAAITTAEVAGDTAKELTEPEVLAVLGKEVRKRTEASEAFAAAGRAELAEKETAEAAVLTSYLPASLTDDELSALVTAAVGAVAEETGADVGPRQLGLVIKKVQTAAEGRADGRRISGAVKQALS